MEIMKFEIGSYYHVRIGEDWYIAIYKPNAYFDILSLDYRLNQVDWEDDEFDEIDKNPITRTDIDRRIPEVTC